MERLIGPSHRRIRRADVSPRSTARLAGAFYVLAGAASVIGGVYIPGKLVVPDDAAASAKACSWRLPVWVT
jgi:hypothetical protein